MPSQTRSSLATLTSLLCDDPNNRLFTAAQVLAKLQEAQEKFVLDTRVLRDSATDSTVSGTQEYSLPSDVMDIVRIAVAGVELRRISKADLDFYNAARWDQTNGVPKYYYVDLDPNNKVFGFYPTPNTSGSSDIAVEYVKIPPTLSADASVPFDGHTLLIPYHNAIADWAAWKLLSIRPSQENLVRRQDFKRSYDDAVSDCIETFKHMEQSESWRMVGGRYHKGL